MRAAGRSATLARAGLAALLVTGTGPAALRAQALERPYPHRILTIEAARFSPQGHGVVGLGDSRISTLDGLEVVSQTVADAVGLLNVGVKMRIVDQSGSWPSVTAGGRYYHSVGGLIDRAVREIAESFTFVKDADISLRGVTGYSTATWTLGQDRTTHAHLSAQFHLPLEASVQVQDTLGGPGDDIEFEDGQEVSLMIGIDRSLVGTALLLLAEAGYSWGQDRARLGVGVDAGSRDWRIKLGAMIPGIETRLGSESVDLPVTPVFSVHRRF